MSKKKINSAQEKHYTFNVSFSFDMQYTFTDNEIQAAEEGREGDVEPTGEALAALEKEITECLSQNYAIGKIEADADFDSLLGIVEE